MHLSLPLFSFTQWKDKCASYSLTTKKLTHSMRQVSLVVKYDYRGNSVDPDQTVPGSSLFVEEASITFQQTTKSDNLYYIGVQRVNKCDFQFI